MDTVDVMAWIESDAAECGALLAAAPPDAPVPTCPGWTADDLVGHLAGGFAGWYSYNIASTPESWKLDELLTALTPVGGDQQAKVDAFAAGVATFLGLCRELDLDRPAWVFNTVEPARFWVRRAAVELTVHLMDAASIHGDRPSTSAVQYSEGVDEWMRLLPNGLAIRRFMRQLTPDTAKPDPVIPAEPAGIAATDTGRAWSMRPDGTGNAVASAGLADDLVAVGSGSSGDLLAWFFGRPTTTPLDVEGDAAVLQRWNLWQQSID